MLSRQELFFFLLHRSAAAVPSVRQMARIASKSEKIYQQPIFRRPVKCVCWQNFQRDNTRVHVSELIYTYIYIIFWIILIN